MSIEEIRGALAQADQQVQEVAGQCQGNADALEAAVGMLAQITDGVGNTDVQDALGMLRSALEDLGQLAPRLQNASEKVTAYSAYL